MNIQDIRNKNDLRHFKHYKIGDVLPDGVIDDIVLVQDEDTSATVLFFDNGNVGSVCVPKPADDL